MIVCYINNQPAYPAAQSDIKVTLQNPFIKDGDEKTMEVIFPMEIPQNATVFGAINRIDTSFESEDFEDCRLVADNIEVIRGKGTITSITQEEVKIQILAGKSYLRYKASFDNIYIDEIDYGQVAERYRNLIIGRASDIRLLNFASELNSQGFIGEAGKYAFFQAHDETNDFYANELCYMRDSSDKAIGVTLMNGAVQPNLMMVLKKVFERLGYKTVINDYDKEPWSSLYVCSARKSLSLGGALPHWSCYKFLDEFRKLFNAVYIFNEKQSQVSIVHFGEAGGAGTEYITPAEGFSAGYDEEGLEYLGSSNIEYELSSCERSVDSISEDVKKAFTVREYSSYGEMKVNFNRMPLKDKMTSLFKIPVGWYYGRSIVDENGNVTGQTLAECGWFSPLIRKVGASMVSLSIVPVAMMWGECHFCTALADNGNNGAYIIPHKEYSFDCLVANIECENQTNISGWSSVDDTADYVTVEDVLENGDSTPEEGSDDSTLQIFFASGAKYKATKWEMFAQYSESDPWGVSDPENVWQPIAFTECRHTNKVVLPRFSMSLFPAADYTHIGNFHNRGIKIRRNVNGNNEIRVDFLFDGKPDPKKIYIIRNRKFICDRIEMGITGEGISPLKTGYFYEVVT